MALSVEQAPHSGYQFHFFGLTSLVPVTITVVGPTIPSVGDPEVVVLASLLAAAAAWILHRRGDCGVRS
jgi:hypothetical protein